MKKLNVIMPETKEKKPYLTCGSPAFNECFMTDGNGNKIKMSPSAVVKVAKNTHKRLGVSNYISHIEVIDHGSYYTCSCC